MHPTQVMFRLNYVFAFVFDKRKYIYLADRNLPGYLKVEQPELGGVYLPNGFWLT